MRAQLPSDQEAAELLEQLGVQPSDRETTLAARPDPTAHPELWSVLERKCDDLLAGMGVPPPGLGWPELPEDAGPVGRHLYVWTCLAILPHVRAYHADRDVPDDVSWASLAALGNELASARRLTGVGGLGASWGLPRTFAGVSYRLGRLAFDRQRPLPPGVEHPVLGSGQSGLNTHVPAGERLDPGLCDDSFARARSFFPGRFPEQVAGFGCHSWLMDDQLTAYLPPTSNILRFQRRFSHFNDQMQADWAPVQHLFHRRYDSPEVPPALLDELPQHTTLHRAIVAHLRGGGHWYNRTGWFSIS
jgi:GNAT domain-containint protein/N-acyltransferase family protein